MSVEANIAEPVIDDSVNDVVDDVVESLDDVDFGDAPVDVSPVDEPTVVVAPVDELTVGELTVGESSVVALAGESSVALAAAEPTVTGLVNTDEDEMYKMIETVSESIAACADFPNALLHAPHDQARVCIHSSILIRQQKTLEELRELMVLIVNVMDSRADA